MESAREEMNDSCQLLANTEEMQEPRPRDAVPSSDALRDPAAPAENDASKASSPGPGTSRKAIPDFGEATRKSMKRKSNAKPDAKRKKHLRRTPRVGYTVQEGDDMLLIISNVNQYDSKWVPAKRAAKKKKKVTKRGKSKVSGGQRKAQKSTSKTGCKPPLQEEVNKPAACGSGGASEHYDRWGQTMPVEILVKIFRLVVNQNGAIPFLCRVSQVCQLWNSAAATPFLWQSATISHCWIEPGKTQLPKTELRIKNTVRWLAENRFSQLRELSICHWKHHVNYVVEVISQFCSLLTSLKLTYCAGMSGEAFQNLGAGCPLLESLNVQYSEVQMEGFVNFLETYGSRIKTLQVTYGLKSDKTLSAISKGCCPELKLLEINTKLDSGFCQLPVCIQALQNGCPKLQVFRMLNVTLLPKMARRGASCTSGFPQLEELCLATSSVSFVKDEDLRTLLHSSLRLRVLDIRGCCRITPTGLSTLPCRDLECLYWGLYYSNDCMTASKKGIHLLTKKWNCTLRELDLAGQPFSSEDLEIAMANLAFGEGCGVLKSLNLCGTKISASALRPVLLQCSELSYLNLSSCRYLPRGLKKVYRSQADIHQLLDNL
uniref:F-box and leucine rich repeat protein 6 n=2 Tax=Lepisosteus oculatus TaxID=7918 RepID=W5MQ98_LEPOC|nr:PREDICTED: F-box/LRR-repeat protein 6 [Lepisosteus oculatus]